MKMFLFLLISVLSVNLAYPASVFEDANSAYNKKDFKAAVELYEQILSETRETSSALYFNLGNAYYQLNDFTNAALNYERALKIDPSDDEIKYNRDLTNTRVEDQIVPIPELFYKRWFKAFRDQLSVDTWALMIFILLGLSTAGWFFYVLSKIVVRRKTGFISGIVFFCLAVFGFLLAWSSYQNTIKENSAIVYTQSIQVKGAPAVTGADLFIIHSGTRVEITDQLNDWVKIILVNGNEGWVKIAGLEMI